MATDDQLSGILAKLEMKLSGLTQKLVAEGDSLDLADMTTAAIVDALATIPGALSVAADLVSSGLYRGLGDTFDANTEPVDGQVGGGGGNGWDYTAVMDAATSFPPGQMIETDRGSKAVENVTEFDLIRTAAGWERPIGFGAFPFAGHLIEFSTASGRSITVTHDHRLRAAVGSGDCDWQTAEALFEHMAHVENVALGHPDQLPLLEDRGLATSRLAPQRMPERPVSLDRDLIGDDEVDAPSRAEADLFLVMQPDFIERTSDRELQYRSRSCLLTAGERTEATLAIVGEQRAAHAAFEPRSAGAFETSGAATVPITLGSRDGERRPALRARKLDPLARVTTGERTEAIGRRPDRLTALRARRGWRRISRLFLPPEAPPFTGSTGSATRSVSTRGGTADGASHGGGIHDRIVRAERRWYEGYVYDLTTPSGALLVDGLVAHNCDECESWDGTHYDTWDEIAGPDGPLPDGGPHEDCYGGGRCRCRATIA